jgi:hypothetical protein
MAGLSRARVPYPRLPRAPHQYPSICRDRCAPVARAEVRSVRVARLLSSTSFGRDIMQVEPVDHLSAPHVPGTIGEVPQHVAGAMAGVGDVVQ